MARHKKLEAVEDEDPKLDISSLIDVCFLLLIYFIVATSLIQDASWICPCRAKPWAKTPPRLSRR